jgi:hypothetical protein
LAETQPVSGCARLSIHVELSSGAVTLQSGATCGLLVPETDTAPEFDAARRALRLPIVLRNLSTSHVVAPVRVSFNADSIVRYRNGQAVPGSGSTRTLNADSANSTGRSAAWKYDTLLAASGETQRIAPGARSRRMWLEFTGPELWLRPGGADADTTLSLRLDATATTIQVSSIPAQAPDSVPNGFYADSNLVPLLGDDGIRIVKDIVLVAFEEDATQEQRSAAVSNVSGTVVGGSQTIAGDGIYFVRLPVGGADAVLNATSVLNNLEHVGAASREIVLDSLAYDYLLPRDGTGVGQWQPNVRISTTDANWAFERVAAPLAWGCSTGDPSTKIGVVDNGFHAIADLTPNIAGFSPIGFLNSNEHGTAVASIVGAVGNNNSGMAGMMWRASLRLYHRMRLWPGVIPVRHSTSRDIGLLTSAANDSARAINLSGNAGLERRQMTPQDSVRTDSVRRAVVRLLAFEIGRLASRGIEPLFVLSAGNIDGAKPSANAYANGYPGIADEFPTRVIVVASTGIGDELLADSKRGSLVRSRRPEIPCCH